MERYEPSDLKMVCGDAVFIQNVHSFPDYAVGGAPPHQCDCSSRFSNEHWRFNRCLETDHFSLALFHHCAPRERVCEFIADKHAVFIMFIRRGRVRMVRHTWNGARRDTSFGYLVTVIR